MYPKNGAGAAVRKWLIWIVLAAVMFALVQGGNSATNSLTGKYSYAHVRNTRSNQLGGKTVINLDLF